MNDTINEAQSKPVALFVSDVHLQEGMPRTTGAFLGFLHSHARYAERLYILGDLFEYWAGDDDIGLPYHQRIIDALRAVSNAKVEIFWIAGNRDFLVGQEFANVTGLTLLPDPSVVELAGIRIVLAHGDAQCTDDHDYMKFRAQVRQPEWQRQFLAMPLAQRKGIIEGLRTGSREAQRGKAYDIMDVNASAIHELFAATTATIMIHGHTHRPGCHRYVGSQARYVLPDWDYDGQSPRGGWLALNERSELVYHSIDGNPVETVIRTAS
jgi:UDP-2,3-diacylglucosamine hydrolase